MRIAMIALLSAWLIYYLVFEPFKNRPGHRYRPNWLMVPIISMILIPTAFTEYQWQVMEKQGSRIVQTLSKKEESNLSCQRFFNTLWDTKVSVQGYVDYSKPDTATLKWKQCKTLQTYLSDPSAPTDEQTIAFQVLLHESMHVRGEQNEAATECAALQAHQDAAKKLGSPESSVLINLRHYMRVVYPNMPPQYRDENSCGTAEIFALRK